MKVFNTMLEIHRGNEATDEYTSLVQEIEDYQKDLPPEYGKPKKWSREIFILIAAKRVGLSVSRELIIEATDAYWMNLTQKASIIPGVLELIAEIKRHNRPFYLVTGSDARLKQQENGKFAYDPKYSEDFKRERVALLRQRGINFNLVSIGDPEDKPHREFFDKAIDIAEEDLGEKIDLSNAIIIGDSFSADLQTPKEQLDFGWVVLFQDGKENTDIIDEHQITTGNLATIIPYLD
jgi:FMN phosphatase YigB (HAD superfamily)